MPGSVCALPPHGIKSTYSEYKSEELPRLFVLGGNLYHLGKKYTVRTEYDTKVSSVNILRSRQQSSAPK